MLCNSLYHSAFNLKWRLSGTGHREVEGRSASLAEGLHFQDFLAQPGEV
jgi:hypothetical protein